MSNNCKVPSWLKDDPKFNSKLNNHVLNYNDTKHNTSIYSGISINEINTNTDDMLDSVGTLFCGMAVVYLLHNGKLPLGSMLKLVGSILNGEIK